MNNITELGNEEKANMIKQRMNGYKAKHFELHLDLIAQQSIDGTEQHIKVTRERMTALEKSYNAMEIELKGAE